MAGSPEGSLGEMAVNAGERVNQIIKVKSEDIKQSFQRLQGRVFHAIKTINGANYMYRYRVGFDGKLKLEQKLRGIYVTGQRIDDTRRRLIDAGKNVPKTARRKWRAAVTGDPDKRIRDHIRETPQVKMLDKLSFTLGVLTIVLSEWLLLRWPHHFPHFYLCLMILLLSWRFYDYRAIKSELFLLDFCYFVNLSVILQIFFYPTNRDWFEVNFCLCLGPVCTAIVVWQNSLVFHSIDKVTSFFLHSFPTLVVHGIRWGMIETNLPIDRDSTLTWTNQFGKPFVAYLVWQITYLFLTEVVFAEKLRNDDEYITSIRYLARDHKNPFTINVNRICRKYNLLPDGQWLDPNTASAKVVFVITQALYTVATFSHVGIIYTNFSRCSAFIIIVFSIGVWNGASYYIEVFSKRYNLKFVEKAQTSDRENSDVDGKTSDHHALAADNASEYSAGSVSDGDKPEDPEDDDDFVEALESLDLSEPDDLKLYTDILEPFLVAEQSDSENSQDN